MILANMPNATEKKYYAILLVELDVQSKQTKQQVKCLKERIATMAVDGLGGEGGEHSELSTLALRWATKYVMNKRTDNLDTSTNARTNQNVTNKRLLCDRTCVRAFGTRADGEYL